MDFASFSKFQKNIQIEVLQLKIGLITIIGYNNYGNKLQNYAVQTVLEDNEFEVNTIINPQCIADYKYIKGHYKEKFKAMIKSSKLYYFQKKIQLNKLNDKTKINKFLNFTKKNINVDNFEIFPYTKNIPIIDDYNYFIVGSDQVWNYNHYRGSWIDFLQFAPPEKRIAYAASIGLDEIPKEREEQFKKYISGMKYISVREQRAKEIIEELTDKKADVVLDPTLMLSAEQWAKISVRPSIDIPQKYILLYFLGKISDVRMSYIKEYAQKHEYSILDIDNLKDKENNIYVADPGEWVYLIANCQCMFTDSFHGCVFSIIHHKDFEVFHRIKDDGSDAGMFSRIETLTSMFKLKNRIQEENCYKNKPHITTEEFSYVDNVIKYERERTYKLLKGAMSNDTE